MNEVTEAAKTGSRVGTTWGIVVIILGVLAIAMPFVAGVAIVATIGVILIATGAAELMYAFKSKSFGEGAFRFLFSILAVLAGLYLLFRPGAGLATITLFLAVWFFIDGIACLVQGFRWRPSEGWGWMVFSGIVSIILGVMIWRQFPVSAVWLVGVLVGIRLLFTGLAMVMMGSVVGAITDEVEQATEESGDA